MEKVTCPECRGRLGGCEVCNGTGRVTVYEEHEEVVWSHNELMNTMQMTPELIKNIEEFLERCGGEHFPESVVNYGVIQANATEWLRAFIIYLYQHRSALGYETPGHIIENSEIQNGIAQALEQQNELLKAALIEVRAAVWDEYVPASLSAKVHRIVDKAL